MKVEKDIVERAIRRAKTRGIPSVAIYRGSTIAIREINRKKPFMQFIPDQSLDCGGITFDQFTGFLGQFNKHLFKQFINNPSLFDIYIDANGSVRKKNTEVFEAIPNNTWFYAIDINSAYWQALFKLGYISKDYFNDYMKIDEYKVAKRLCVSFMARHSAIEYISEKGSHKITCDNSVMIKVYANVRNYLQNIIQEVVDIVPEVIEYNIDAVTVRTNYVDAALSVFTNYGLDVKINGYVKTGSNEYRHGNQMKQFVARRKQKKVA